jgi:hypothetical protein
MPIMGAFSGKFSCVILKKKHPLVWGGGTNWDGGVALLLAPVRPELGITATPKSHRRCIKVDNVCFLRHAGEDRHPECDIFGI